MGELYGCDFGHAEQCVGIEESRSNFLGLTAGNDQQEKVLCCIHCLPDSITVPAAMKRNSGGDQ